jgi:hypothetical protein
MVCSDLDIVYGHLVTIPQALSIFSSKVISILKENLGEVDSSCNKEDLEEIQMVINMYEHGVVDFVKLMKNELFQELILDWAILNELESEGIRGFKWHCCAEDAVPFVVIGKKSDIKIGIHQFNEEAISVSKLVSLMEAERIYDKKIVKFLRDSGYIEDIKLDLYFIPDDCSSCT